MKVGKWEVWFECGWYTGNPPAGLLIKVGEIVEDWPKGWLSIAILAIQIGKFCLGFGIGK